MKLITALLASLAQTGISDFTELWSTEHFEDIILTDAYGTSRPALSPAIVALYETECKNKLYNDIGFTDNKFPNGLHLQFTTFDRSHARSKVWYQWDTEVMDLFYYYNISTEGSIDSWCPTILYQPANFSLAVEFYNPTDDGKFEDWVWDMIKIENMEFSNTLNQNVMIMFRYMNPGKADIINEQIITVIPPKTTATVDNLHAGDILVVATENGETLNRYIMDTITTSIDIEISTDATVIDDTKFLEKYNNDHNLLLRRNWSTRRRYLNNIKSPPLMPTFTEHGFKHVKAPKEICDYVTDFYNSQKDRKRLESFPQDGTQINAREIPTYMMHIPGDKKRWIASIMEPILSEWSGMELAYSTMYGLREYVHGAVLKGHVDRIETHIISAIIHITHSPHNISWPLEVVSWDGKRYNIIDTDCDMVFYESSKLIHGRPEAYKGDSWINAFLHFRPKSWKGYTFTPQNVVKTPNAEVPLVDFIYG